MCQKIVVGYKAYSLHEMHQTSQVTPLFVRSSSYYASISCPNLLFQYSAGCFFLRGPLHYPRQPWVQPSMHRRLVANHSIQSCVVVKPFIQ